jgi:ferredoxin
VIPVTFEGRLLEVALGQTLLSACEKAGIAIE